MHQQQSPVQPTNNQNANWCNAVTNGKPARCRQYRETAINGRPTQCNKTVPSGESTVMTKRTTDHQTQQ
jgi:hypothetical protein